MGMDPCRSISRQRMPGAPQSCLKWVPHHKRDPAGSHMPFLAMRDELYSIDGVILKGEKILIPLPLRAETLECLHATHQGVNEMLANAQQRVFWPCLEANLCQTRAQCQACNKIAPSHAKEPLADPPMPEFLFQYTVTNLCDIRGNTFLIFADKYTGWVEAAVIKDPTSKKVCHKL